MAGLSRYRCYMKRDEMPPLHQCQICKKAINPDGKDVHRRVWGWTDAKQGAKQATVSFPVEMNQYAHSGCVRLLRMGVSEAQSSLF